MVNSKIDIECDANEDGLFECTIKKDGEIIDKIISDDFDNVGSLVSKRLRLVRRE